MPKLSSHWQYTFSRIFWIPAASLLFFDMPNEYNNNMSLLEHYHHFIFLHCCISYFSFTFKLNSYDVYKKKPDKNAFKSFGKTYCNVKICRHCFLKLKKSAKWNQNFFNVRFKVLIIKYVFEWKIQLKKLFFTFSYSNIWSLSKNEFKKLFTSPFLQDKLNFSYLKMLKADSANRFRIFFLENIY